MHEKTLVLFDCGPLPTHMYENCRGCSGVTGKGEAVYVTASNPRAERVAVITIDGVFGYV